MQRKHNTWLEHKGLVGSINQDTTNKVWFGTVRISSMMTVSYTAGTERELQQAFKRVVDELSVRI
jgi:hypothetical protein